ncbi:Septin-7, partial [Stegodyphus mimosarum]
MFFRESNTTPSAPTTASVPSVPANFAPNVNNFTPSVPLSNLSKENSSITTSTYAKETPFREMDGYVGFANLPNQVYRKAVKKGFEFTLMVVGGAGLGKSTLINSMFLTDIYSNEYPGPSLRAKKTVQVW